jgi:hypothetical protein
MQPSPRLTAAFRCSADTSSSKLVSRAWGKGAGAAGVGDRKGAGWLAGWLAGGIHRQCGNVSVYW